MTLPYRPCSLLAVGIWLIVSSLASGQANDSGSATVTVQPRTTIAPGSSPAAGPGCVSSCVECDTLYASDLQGRLWRIDPVTGVATFIGWSSTPMLDIAISSDGYLFGTSTPSATTPVWRISACDASNCLDGTLPNAHNSLGADLLGTDLFAAGPPLTSLGSGAPYASTAVGGTVGPGTGQWCGPPSGDIAVDPTSPTDLYVTLFGCTAACPGGADMLAKLDTATGDATNIGCLLDTGTDVDSVFGLAFDGAGGLFGLANPTGGELLSIDKLTASVNPIAMTGGPLSATGLASISCSGDCDPDLDLPTIDCGVIAGPCGSPPFTGPSSIVTDCGDEICLYANASDNCGVLSLTAAQLPAVAATSPTGAPITAKYSESFSTPGVYEIAWDATDSHGNTVSCSATVDVRCDQCTQLPANATNWWPLDETTPTAADLAGSTANNGGHAGAPVPAPGHVAGAQCFNGSSDQVVVPNHAEVNFPGTAALGSAQDFTIDLWVQTGKTGGRQILMDKRSTEQMTTLFGYMLFLDAGYFGLHLADGSVSFSTSCDPNPSVSHCTEWIAPTDPVDDGSWHFVAVTVERFSPTGGTLWVDGAPVLTFDPTARLGNLNTVVPLRIAREQPFIGSTGFVGCLDEIEFFDRALSTAEIAALHRSGADGKCKCDGDDLSQPCPIGQQEYDTDGDGCKEGCICDAAFLGECLDCSNTTGACISTGLDCGPSAILFDSNCDCVYDLCTPCPSGTYPRDTDGDGCEDVCDCYKPVVLHAAPVGIFWDPDPDLPFVDIVVGSLSVLKSTRGDFAQATLQCLANDAQGNFVPYSQNPPPGNGVWFLARPVTSAGFGTYDSTPTSHEGRDPGIAASGRDCAP